MCPNRAALLVVDDDPASRALLRHYLTPQGFDLTDAATAADALAMLAARRFDLLLLDVELPDGNGLEVLTDLRRRYSASELPVVMATVRDRSSDVVEALRRGANDYLTKPFDLPVVLARLQTQWSLKQARDRAQQLEQALWLRNAELEQANHALADANRQLRQDLEAAAAVQQALLPTAAPPMPGAAFAWHYRPCSQLGGDLLGLVGLPGNRACIYVLDVVHHGAKAALLAVIIHRALCRLLADDALAPAAVATELNREFAWMERTEQFFTLMLGVVDPAGEEFRFVSAGHPGPLYQRCGQPPEDLRFPGVPIGLGIDDFDEHRLPLHRGDRLFLYSDGLIDARGARPARFGQAQCVHELHQAADVPLTAAVPRLIRAVEAWCAPAGPDDDLTVAAVELL